MRHLGAEQVITATRSWIWARRSIELVTIGLKICSEGEFRIPAPDQLSTVLPQVVIEYAGGSFVRDKARRAIRGTHTLEVHSLRLLGDTDSKGVLVRQHAELIGNLFAQGDYPLPGYTPVNNVLIDDASPTALAISEGFLLGDLAEVEQATVTLVVTTMSYDNPAL